MGRLAYTYRRCCLPLSHMIDYPNPYPNRASLQSITGYNPEDLAEGDELLLAKYKWQQ